MNREDRIEEMREADALGFGHEAEEGAVAVEAPGTALLNNFKARFIMPVEESVCHLPGRVEDVQPHAAC